MKPVSRRRRIIDILLLTGVPIMFYSCADAMIFQPPAPSYKGSADIIRIPVANDEHVAAVYLSPPQDGFVILFSHGNAEDIGSWADVLPEFQTNGFGILAYDYRGYGQSSGKPTEHNTYQDIEAAYQYLTKTAKIAPERIIVHGRSVGCGPSTYLAEKHKIAGLILESPFVSAFRVVTRWPILPFDKFNNLARIKNIHCPVLVIHGRKDRIVPFWHGQTLYNAANQPKTFYWVDNAGHNDLYYWAGNNYWKALTEFRTLIEKTTDL